MRKVLMSAAAGLLLAAPLTGAQAADPYFTPPPPVSYGAPMGYDWSGAYGGATVGAAWSSFDTVYGSPSSNFAFDSSGFSFGVLGGVAAQVQNFVFGLEADISFTDLDETRVITGTPITAEQDWISTFRGRAGYAFDRFQVYGTGGLAAGGVEVSVPGGSRSSTEFGWTLGAGVEAALTDNFTARAEYLYTDLGSASGTIAGNPFSTEFDSHTLRAGVTYRFR